jgi:GT2 family glycosyltransferase
LLLNHHQLIKGLISIIICSRTSQIPDTLSKGIESTIGVPYELIVIDNSKNDHTIFTAYNKGVKKSKFPYLCFMHDDIMYHTNNWGQGVIKHFEDEKTGAIGVAGSPYAPYMPGPWWGGLLVNEYLFANPVIIKQCPKTKSTSNEVAVLDGVWFCIRKSLFDHIAFDDINFSGFHFYDIDICLQIKQAGYNIYSVFDILIQHFSTGHADIHWQKNALVFHQKWKSMLPLACTPLKYADKCEAELKTIDEFAFISMVNKKSLKNIYTLAFLTLLKYYRIYFYYKTYLYMGKYLYKSLK